MAGLYADIPGTRFALDQDGSVVKWRNYTTLGAWTDTTASIAEAQKVNTANYVDMNVGNDSTVLQVAVAFPEARSIAGIFTHFGFSNNVSNATTNLVYEYSTDTTDGTDGTWTSFTVTYTSLANHCNLNHNPKPYYRSDIVTLSLNNVKGIRIRWSGTYGSGMSHRMFVYHIYGSRPTASVDRLAFWNPSTDQAIGVAALDFGDIAQGTSVTRQFRVKNLSGSLTANNITVQVSDILPDYTGTGVQVSTDNSTYTSSINIGNLASGTISATLYVRRTVPGAETPTQRNARLLANAASWT